MKQFAASMITAAALALGSVQLAQAVEVSGIKIEDTATVAGKSLVLNGAGIRYKLVKVYALGLYLTEKKNAVADILALGGPKRFKIVLMRDLTSEEFGQAFLTGINKNLDKEEKSKFVNQLVRLGEVFNEVEGVKKGDTVIGDFVPGTGTTFTINGKPVGAPFPDPAFYGAILRIWIGGNPADPSLKPLLLGEEPASR